MVLAIILLLIGFVLLIKGADFFVDGASAVARRLNIPTVVIGLTIAAIGTSLPEAAVSVSAGLGGNADIAICNVVGSNIVNFLLVLGLSALIRPVLSNHSILRRDFPWCLIASLLVTVFCFFGILSRIMGAILLIGIVAYMIVVVRSAMRDHAAIAAEDNKEPELRNMSVLRIVLSIVGGLVAIVLGGTLVVNNAQFLALAWGMSERLVGLTIVAIGTSLPELVTSVMAAKKGESDLALGNVVGSCIFNLLFILGAASTIVPISVSHELIFDALVMLVVTALLFLLSRTRQRVGRLEGAVCVIVYIAYLVFSCLR